jgi:hypothetical protein
MNFKGKIYSRKRKREREKSYDIIKIEKWFRKFMMFAERMEFSDTSYSSYDEKCLILESSENKKDEEKCEI